MLLKSFPKLSIHLSPSLIIVGSWGKVQRKPHIPLPKYLKLSKEVNRMLNKIVLSSYLDKYTLANIYQKHFQFSLVQFSCSVVSDYSTPWIAARQASLSVTNSRSSLRLTFIRSMMPSSHLILCCPLLLLTPIPPASES